MDAAYPNRFAGLATVDLDRPMEAVRELRRRVENGFVGLRVVPWLWKAAAHRSPLLPAVRRVRRSRACRSAPRSVTPGRCGRRRPAGRFPYIDQVALDFPELVIVCGHVGYPWTEEMVAVARKHENVYIDTSAYTHQAAARRADPIHENPYRTTKSVVRHQLSDDRARRTRWPVSTTSASPTRLGTTFCVATPSGCSVSQNDTKEADT